MADFVRMEVWVPADLDRQIREELGTDRWANRTEFVRAVLRRYFAEARP